MSGEKKVVDLMAELEASLKRAKALAEERRKRAKCERCRGVGEVCPDDEPLDISHRDVPCPDCDGTGWAK